jgi:8-oxo-dGTP diphosphatase
MSQPPVRPIAAVGAVVWNDDGEVLLIRRGNPPRQGAWSIPGGKVEWGESLTDALVREVREETGIAVEVLGLIEVLDSRVPGNDGVIAHHHILIDYSAKSVGGSLAAGDDASDARFVHPADLGQYALWAETKRIIAKSAELLGRKIA